MKDLRAIRGTHYIHSLIAEGEHQRQDFKFAISDARKIARSISAFANREGGRLLIGVKDNGAVAGVRNEEDVYMIETAAQIYCAPAQEIKFTAYRVGDGAIVVVAEISQALTRPVRAQEPDGTWRSYYRVADENIVASPLMVRAWMRAASAHGGLLSFSSIETQLLAMIREAPTAPADILLRLPASRHTIEEAVVRLASIGVLDFHYDGSRFLLTAAD